MSNPKTRESKPIVLKDGAPRLFLDNSLVARQCGVTRTVHPGQVRDQPVLEPDQPWEGSRINIYGTVLRDPESGTFRMWYQCGPESSPKTIDGQEGEGLLHVVRPGQGDRVMHATSVDGIHWEKPDLGLYRYNGSTANNIIYNIHTPSVIVDARESDSAKRYKMAGYQGVDPTGYRAAYSADGLRWYPYEKEVILPGGDTLTLTQHPETGEYLAYHKQHTEIRGFRRRLIYLSRSSDFQNWTKPELVLAPDEIDDLWTVEPDQRTEFYIMSVFPWGGIFLGLVAVLQVTQVNPDPRRDLQQSPVDGPCATELVYSNDGVRWHRLEERMPVIPTGGPGRFDEGMILAVANAPVVVGDEMWVYYAAFNTGHGATMPPKRATIGLATWRMDGFVSLDGHNAGGEVETVELETEGGALYVNANASRGSLRVEVLDTSGAIIPGYSRAECLPVDGDGVRLQVRWEKQPLLPASGSVRLRFFPVNTELFSFSEDAEK
jgi:hypothetical protein